jgi:hypothetical protein
MSATLTRTERATDQVAELGRYVTAAGEARVLVARRIEGVVRVYDVPASRKGQMYRVESGLRSMAELAGLVADYKRQARRFGSPPVSRASLDRIAEDAKELEDLVG